MMIRFNSRGERPKSVMYLRIFSGAAWNASVDQRQSIRLNDQVWVGNNIRDMMNIRKDFHSGLLLKSEYLFGLKVQDIKTVLGC